MNLGTIINRTTGQTCPLHLATKMETIVNLNNNNSTPTTDSLRQRDRQLPEDNNPNRVSLGRHQLED
jgi:hypothetical protein